MFAKQHPVCYYGSKRKSSVRRLECRCFSSSTQYRCSLFSFLLLLLLTAAPASLKTELLFCQQSRDGWEGKKATKT